MIFGCLNYFSCFFSKKNQHAVSCDRELSECAKIVHYVYDGLINLFRRKKKSKKSSLLIFDSVLSLKLIIDCDFFLLQVPFFGRNTRKAFNLENDQSIVSRLKSYT